MSLATRLAAFERAFQQGIAHGNGCAVCKDWGWCRATEHANDPWAAFDGVCPICGRSPELVFCVNQEAADRLCAQYAGIGGVAFIVGPGLYDAI
jgi:hypothetical protein